MATKFYQQYTQKAFAPKADADEQEQSNNAPVTPTPEGGNNSTTPNVNSTPAVPTQQPPVIAQQKPNPTGGKPITPIQSNDTNPDNYPQDNDDNEKDGTPVEKAKSPLADIDYDDPSFFTKLTQILTEKPTMTKEEAEKRDKAARAAHDVASLAHGITAISNVALSGEAPSQDLPQLYKINPTQYADRAKAERIKYAQSMLGAAGKDHATRMAREKNKADTDYKNFKMNFEIGKEQAQRDYRAALLALKAAKNADDRANAQAKLKLATQRLNEARRHNLQTENNSSGKKQQWDPVVIKGPNGQTRSYDMNKDQEVHEYWKYLRDNGIYQGFPEDEPTSANDRRAYIFSHLGEFQKGSSKGLGHDYSQREKDNYRMEYSDDGWE